MFRRLHALINHRKQPSQIAREKVVRCLEVRFTMLHESNCRPRIDNPFYQLLVFQSRHCVVAPLKFESREPVTALQGRRPAHGDVMGLQDGDSCILTFLVPSEQRKEDHHFNPFCQYLSCLAGEGGVKLRSLVDLLHVTAGADARQ